MSIPPPSIHSKLDNFHLNARSSRSLQQQTGVGLPTRRWLPRIKGRVSLSPKSANPPPNKESAHSSQPRLLERITDHESEVIGLSVMMLSRLPVSDDAFSEDEVLDCTAALLPALTQTTDHILISPTEDIRNFLLKDLSVDKLNCIDPYLWLAGRPIPPKPLNYQIASSREIVVDERIDMHLVWEHTQRLHLKPLPRYLLNSQFWTSYLICNGTCCVVAQCDEVAQDPKPCTKHAYECAMGLLCSYMALIRFESDLTIAHTYNLLPRDITWGKWLRLVQQLLRNGAANPANINRRYLYGELRLSQLNKIYAFRYGSVLRGYQFTYQTYGELFRDYLTPLTAATIYVALVLTAMQVGLATNRLKDNSTFQSASYGFTALSILAPLIGTVMVGLFGIFQFGSNLLEVRGFKRRQLALYDNIVLQRHSA